MKRTGRETAGGKLQTRHVIIVVGIYSLLSVNALCVLLSSSPCETQRRMTFVCMSNTEGKDTSQNAALTNNIKAF